MPQPPTTTRPTPPPNAWMGVLGVALVLGFAGLAITGHASSPSSARADSAAGASPSATPPAALYHDEGGAHDATKPQPKPPASPAPAVSLFE